jgi:hypothetical protein
MFGVDLHQRRPVNTIRRGINMEDLRNPAYKQGPLNRPHEGLRRRGRGNVGHEEILTL